MAFNKTIPFSATVYRPYFGYQFKDVFFVDTFLALQVGILWYQKWILSTLNFCLPTHKVLVKFGSLP